MVRETEVGMSKTLMMPRSLLRSCVLRISWSYTKRNFVLCVTQEWHSICETNERWASDRITR